MNAAGKLIRMLEREERTLREEKRRERKACEK